MKRHPISAAVAASLAILVQARLSWTAFGAAALIASAGASAQSSTQRVTFAPGASSVSVRGSIRGEQTIDYVLRAQRGDRFTVFLKAGRSNAYMNVMAPGASEALHIGSISGARFATALPSSGDYLVRVYLMRSAARRGERADYSIDFALRSPAATLPSRPAYADGNAGGPDYFQVFGLAPRDPLKVRSQPAASASVIGSLRNGATVRNGGCRTFAGQRWCNVNDPAGRFSGWANARYLRDASSQQPNSRWRPERPSATTLPTPDAPPQIILGTNGTGEVIFDQNRCVAYYNRQGRRSNVVLTCRPDQLNRADDAMARHRREQGL